MKDSNSSNKMVVLNWERAKLCEEITVSEKIAPEEVVKNWLRHLAEIDHERLTIQKQSSSDFMNNEYEQLYEKSRHLLESIDELNSKITLLPAKNVTELKIKERLGALLNNSIVELIVLNDLLFELSEAEDISDIENLLDLVEVEGD